MHGTKTFKYTATVLESMQLALVSIKLALVSIKLALAYYYEIMALVGVYSTNK